MLNLVIYQEDKNHHNGIASHMHQIAKIKPDDTKDVENLEPIQVNVSISAATSQNNLEAPREIKNMDPLRNQQ